MKKLLVILIGVFMLFGCKNQSESNYIETLKNMNFGEEKILYADNVEFLARNIITLMNQGTRINVKDIKWTIGDKLDEGKMVIADYHGDKVFFFTYEEDNTLFVDFERSYSQSKFGVETPIASVFPYENEFMEKMLNY